MTASQHRKALADLDKLKSQGGINEEAFNKRFKELHAMLTEGRVVEG